MRASRQAKRFGFPIYTFPMKKAWTSGRVNETAPPICRLPAALAHILSYLAALGMVVSFAAIFIQFLAWIDPLWI